jgi:hypothetical protein
MNKSQNRNTGNKRMQGNIISQKDSNHKIENSINSEGNASLHAEVRGMIRMFKEVKKGPTKTNQ